MGDEYRVSAGRLGRILDRLDQEYERSKLSCIEWIAFFFLKVLSYAFPVLVSAILVSTLLPERPFLSGLQNLLGYTLILAAVFVPANLRLIVRSLRHQRLTYDSHYRLASRLWGKRGRAEESPHAQVAVVAGLPAVLFLFSAEAGGWMLALWVIACAGLFLLLREAKRFLDEKGRRRSDSYYGLRVVLQDLRRGKSDSDEDSSAALTKEEMRRAHRILVGGAVALALLLALTIVLGVEAGLWWRPPLVLAICFGLFLALREVQQLAEYPRRRLDFLREVKVHFFALRQKAERAGGRPVVLTRSTALRLSDIDRMLVLRQRAGAILSYHEEGTAGYTLSMSSEAMARARELPESERLKTHMAIEQLWLDAEARKGRARDGEYIVVPVRGAALELLFTVDDQERVVHIESVGPSQFSDGTLEAGAD